MYTLKTRGRIMEVTHTLSATEFLAALIKGANFEDRQALTAVAERTVCNAFERLGSSVRTYINRAFPQLGLHNPVIQCAWTPGWQLSLALADVASYDSASNFCNRQDHKWVELAPVPFVQSDNGWYSAVLDTATIEYILARVYNTKVHISSKHMIAFAGGFMR